MDFSIFDHKIDFPLNPNIVYVFIIEINGNSIPIYVGKSSRNIGRIGDYISAQFKAPTDFKVGEAINRLLEKKIKIKFLYKELENEKDAKDEEEKLIKEYTKYLSEQNNDLRLLNGNLKGCDHKNIDEERKKIIEFVDNFIIKIGLENNSTRI